MITSLASRPRARGGASAGQDVATPPSQRLDAAGEAFYHVGHADSAEVYAKVGVLVECPTSGSLVPTGVYVLGPSEIEPINLLPSCPDCGRDHRWRPSDAVLPGRIRESIEQ